MRFILKDATGPFFSGPSIESARKHVLSYWPDAVAIEAHGEYVRRGFWEDDRALIEGDSCVCWLEAEECSD